MLSSKRHPYPIATVWRELLSGIFSTLGRLESLARCRDLQTGHYRHIKIENELGERDTQRAIDAVHELIWRDWMRGSLEQQHADLLIYAHSRAKSPAELTRMVSNWLINPPFPAFAPQVADADERALFARNLQSLLTVLQGAYSSTPHCEFPADPFSLVLSAIQKDLRNRAYPWPASQSSTASLQGTSPDCSSGI